MVAPTIERKMCRGEHGEKDFLVTVMLDQQSVPKNLVRVRDQYGYLQNVNKKRLYNAAPEDSTFTGTEAA